MKPCGYCGRDNDGQAHYCCDCGTPLSDQEVSTSHEAHELNARCATFILLFYLAPQVVVGMIEGFIRVSIGGAQGADIQKPQELLRFTQLIHEPAILVSTIAGGAVMLLLSRKWLPHKLSDTSPTGAAWVVGSSKHITQGLCAGALACCGYLALAVVFRDSIPQVPRDLLSTTALTSGLNQFLWLLTALVFAPFIEELLFRGVLYGGYRSSLGPVRAAVLSTVIFWILHITQIIYFWPAMIGIGALAMVALFFRLRSGAIGPAVAVHLGYNGLLAIYNMCLLISLRH